MKWWMIMLIIMVVAIVILFILYKIGNKLQARQVAQKEQLAESAQPATMLIIDKKYLPMKDAGLPKMVLEQTPKRYQKQKLPIVKAKVGPQIINFICDDAIYDDVPTKGEVKAMISGIYILSVKSVRNKKKNAQVEEETKKEKKGFGAKMRAKQAQYQKQINDEIMAKAQNKEKNPEKSKAQLKKEKEREKMISKNAVK